MNFEGCEDPVTLGMSHGLTHGLTSPSWKGEPRMELLPEVSSRVSRMAQPVSRPADTSDGLSSSPGTCSRRGKLKVVL